VQGHRENREKEAEAARILLEEDAQGFLSWLKSLESVPLIRRVQEKMDALRRDELEKARYLNGLDADQQEAVDRFSRALMKRFMHPTLKALKTLPEDIEGDLFMGAARTLFDLDHKTSKRAQELNEHKT